jgi:DNA-binding transcriptional LysR family regulator
MSRQFDDLSLGTLELFCLAAELQSFSAAANSAGLTPPAVSRTIARLEARLGTPLFARTTRQVRLSDAGRSYYEQCKQAIEQIAQAEEQVSGAQTQPSGTVRVSLPTSYGHLRVLPLLPVFRQQYPGVELELHLSNRNVDFTAEGFDLAVRGRTQPDSNLIARKLEDADLVVVAAPSYLAQRGAPRSIDDLAGHECVHFALPSTGQLVPWELLVDGRIQAHSVAGGLRCFDDIIGPITLARHGAGLVQTYRFLVQADLQSGALQEVLHRHAGASRPFSLLFPAGRHMPRRVRVLIDFLTEQLSQASSTPASTKPRK